MVLLFELQVTRRSGKQQGVISFELCLHASASPSSHKSISEHDSQIVVTPATPFNPSAPPLPQLVYERDSSTRSTWSTYKNVSQRAREIVSEDSGYGEMVVFKASNSRGKNSMSRHEEFSLLDS